MKITISNVIHIHEPNEVVKKYCREKLTYKNPDYQKKKMMGFYVYNIPKEIKLYDFYNGDLYVPLGCFDDLWELHPYKEDYKDYSISKPIKIESTIKLRDYQKPCLKAIEENYNGLFILPAGTGKTITALECVHHLKQKCIWLTHTKDLLNQAKTECEENMTCKTSTITEGKCDCSGDIVFATVQTLVNIIDKGEIKQDEFGMLIADEVHHCSVSAETVMQFQQCVNFFACRYKIGLTATLHTANGLHVTIPKILGKVLYEMKKEDDLFNGYYLGDKVVSVPAMQFQIPAQIHLIKTNYSVQGKDVFDLRTGTVNFSKLITSISEDRERNGMILELLANLKGSTIVVGDRVDQLKLLASKWGDNAIFIDGKTKKSVREEGLEKVRNGEIELLFASYKLIAEGFNAPILENLVMVTPVKDLRIVVQSIGRVQRPYPNKTTAHVYDLVDDVGKLDKFLRERKKIYKKEGYEIDDRRS